MSERLRVDETGVARCWWPGEAADYVAYHDDEWGRAVIDDTRLFEKLCLEGFQSGLSWLTILRKRENFRAAFAGFDCERVARFGDRDVARLLADAGIVRHRGKIESTINNAQRCLELADQFGSLAAYVWSYEPEAALQQRDPASPSSLLSKSPASIAMSKDLKKRGWSFVGPTTVYAFMQAMGLVNDHIDGCAWRDVCAKRRKRTKVPKPSA